MRRRAKATALPVLLAFIAVFSFSAIAEASGWIFQQSGTTCNLNSVDFVDDLTGFAVGDRATVLATGDGGATWKSIGPVSYATPDFVTANTWAIHWQSVQFLDEKIAGSRGPWCSPTNRPTEVPRKPWKSESSAKPRTPGSLGDCSTRCATIPPIASPIRSL